MYRSASNSVVQLRGATEDIIVIPNQKDKIYIMVGSHHNNSNWMNEIIISLQQDQPNSYYIPYQRLDSETRPDVIMDKKAKVFLLQALTIAVFGVKAKPGLAIESAIETFKYGRQEAVMPFIRRNRMRSRLYHSEATYMQRLHALQEIKSKYRFDKTLSAYTGSLEGIDSLLHGNKLIMLSRSRRLLKTYKTLSFEHQTGQTKKIRSSKINITWDLDPKNDHDDVKNVLQSRIIPRSI